MDSLAIYSFWAVLAGFAIPFFGYLFFLATRLARGIPLFAPLAGDLEAEATYVRSLWGKFLAQNADLDDLPFLRKWWNSDWDADFGAFVWGGGGKLKLHVW